jgi:hypothetical protein
MTTTFDPSGVSAPRLRQAYAYWQGKLGGRAMPSRRDIDPIEMPQLLAHLVLLDVVPEPLDFRFRLIGTEVRTMVARDYTGLCFSELPGKGKGSVVWGNCEKVVLSKAPLSGDPPYVGPEPKVVRCENLLLPLSEDGSEVSMILLVANFERGRR